MSINSTIRPMKKEKKKTRRCLYKYRHILLIRVISFKSRHPETTSPKTNEKKGRRRKFIVDNYGQFQSRRKKREKEKKNPLPIFSTDIIRRSRFVGLNKIHKKSDRVGDRLKPQVSTGIKIRKRGAYKSAISRDR